VVLTVYSNANPQLTTPKVTYIGFRWRVKTHNIAGSVRVTIPLRLHGVVDVETCNICSHTKIYSMICSGVPVANCCICSSHVGRSDISSRINSGPLSIYFVWNVEIQTQCVVKFYIIVVIASDSHPGTLKHKDIAASGGWYYRIEFERIAYLIIDQNKGGSIFAFLRFFIA